MRGILTRIFNRTNSEFRLVQPCEFAHCVIDVQRQFCDPAFSPFGNRRTDATAKTIANITPTFREAGMPTYMIYYQKWNEPPEQAFGGFHRVRPAESDILFGKIVPSAFEYSDLAERLKTAGIRTLLISGFDIENCVNATVQDALRESFNVWVLSDCIGNGGPVADKSAYIRLMRDNGAHLMTSREAISRLRAAGPI